MQVGLFITVFKFVRCKFKIRPERKRAVSTFLTRHLIKILCESVWMCVPESVNFSIISRQHSQFFKTQTHLQSTNHIFISAGKESCQRKDEIFRDFQLNPEPKTNTNFGYKFTANSKFSYNT